MSNNPSEQRLKDANLQSGRETMDALYGLSQLLNTGLDQEALSVLVQLCEMGINPEALAQAVKEISRPKADQSNNH